MLKVKKFIYKLLNFQPKIILFFGIDEEKVQLQKVYQNGKNSSFLQSKFILKHVEYIQKFITITKLSFREI